MKKYVGTVFQNKSVKNYFLQREAFNFKANFLLIENIFFFFREVFFQIKVIFTKNFLDVSNTKKMIIKTNNIIYLFVLVSSSGHNVIFLFMTVFNTICFVF